MWFFWHWKKENQLYVRLQVRELWKVIEVGERYGINNIVQCLLIYYKYAGAEYNNLAKRRAEG
jgi:hypothetical protein